MRTLKIVCSSSMGAVEENDYVNDAEQVAERTYTYEKVSGRQTLKSVMLWAETSASVEDRMGVGGVENGTHMLADDLTGMLMMSEAFPTAAAVWLAFSRNSHFLAVSTPIRNRFDDYSVSSPPSRHRPIPRRNSLHLNGIATQRTDRCFSAAVWCSPRRRRFFSQRQSAAIQRSCADRWDALSLLKAVP